MASPEMTPPPAKKFAAGRTHAATRKASGSTLCALEDLADYSGAAY